MNVFERVELSARREPVLLYKVLAALLLLASIGLLIDAWFKYSARAELLERRADRDFQHQLAAQKVAIQRERHVQHLMMLDEAVKPWLRTAAFPWDELMVSLERVRLPGLRLVSLSVDSKQSTASVVAECLNTDQAAELAKLLDEGRPQKDRRWHLVRVQAKPAPGAGVEAELQFRAVALL